MASITSNKSGTFRVRWKNSIGKTVSKTFREYREAELHKLHIELETKRYGVAPKSMEDKSFKALAKYWLEIEAINKRSLKDDISIIKTHLMPRFGSYRIKDIDTDVVKRMRSELEKTRKAKTVSNILTLLKTMLNRALELKWLEEVPIIKKPRIQKRNKNYVYLKTSSQINEFLSHARAEGDRIEMFYLMAITTGMRLGEICALTWENVNFETRLVKVSCSYDGPTKNGEARQVPILDSLLTRLKKWFHFRTSEFVFPNQSGNMQCKSPRVSKEIFKRVLKKCSFQALHDQRGGEGNVITFHSLRHTFASHYMMNGGDIYRLKEILGHQSIETTMVYAHLDPSRFTRDHSRFNFILEPDAVKLLEMIR